MDDFAVDIDAVLDDFELSEGAPSKGELSGGHSQYAGTGSGPVPVAGIAPLLPAYPQGPVPIMYNMNFDHVDKLDLNEADFAPAPTRDSQSITNELQSCRDTSPVMANGHDVSLQGSEKSSLDTSESSGVVSMSGSESNNQNASNVSISKNYNDNKLKEHYGDSPPELLKSTRAQMSMEVGEKFCQRDLPGEEMCSLPPVSMSHPDVIPTTINPMVEVAKAGCHQTCTEQIEHNVQQIQPESLEGVNQSTASHPAASPQPTSQEDLRGSLSPEPTVSDDSGRQEEVSSNASEVNLGFNYKGPEQNVCDMGRELGNLNTSEPSPEGILLEPSEANDLVSGHPTARNDLTFDGPLLGQSETSVIEFPSRKVVDKELTPVGFASVDDEDVDEGDMNAYLADVEKEMGSNTNAETVSDILNSDMHKSFDDVDCGITTESNLDVKCDMQSTVSNNEISVLPGEEECRGSSESIEKFLAPPIISPCIATPMEDLGFSKVPGYQPMGDITKLDEASGPEYESAAVVAHGSQSAKLDLKAELPQQQDVMSHLEERSSQLQKGGPSPQENGLSHLEESLEDHVDGEHSSRPTTLGVLQDPGQTGLCLSSPVPSQSTIVSPTDKSFESGMMQLSKSPTGIGARPKEPSQMRKNRPNSLLGLSKPDIKSMSPVPYDGGNVEHNKKDTGVENSRDQSTTVENSHDVINRQLALNIKSPLRKKQLNLEIKQQIDKGVISDEFAADNKMGSMKFSGRNCLPHLVQKQPSEFGGEPGQEYMLGADPSQGYMPVNISSQYSSQTFHTEATQVVTQPPPNQVVPQSPLPGPGMGGSASSLPSLEPTLPAQAAGAQVETVKQKRPTSLSLIPRGDFAEENVHESPMDEVVFASSQAGATETAASFQSSPSQDEQSPSESASASETMLSPLEAGPGAFSPPMNSANMNVSITELGKVAPRWVPDAEAPNCMQCEARFTFTKRRHHCRACGKVFCSTCCNLRCKLHYMENKEARVCSKCYQDIVRAQAYVRLHSPVGSAGAPRHSPNPNNPSEYCSTVPPLQQAAAILNAPPPTVMVPVGVLRKEGSQRNREPKQVMFSDGIRPGGDLTELDGSAESRLPLHRKSTRSSKKIVDRIPTPGEAPQSAASMSVSSSGIANPSKPSKPKTQLPESATVRNTCLIPDQGLPPVILSTGVKGDYSIEENPDQEQIMTQIRNGEDDTPVVFAINKNLFVLVKIVNLDCCVNRVCWCFTSKGMCIVGQDEIVIILECLPDEKEVPRDIFCHLNSVFEEAGKANTVSHLGHTIFGQSFLDSKDHCGFLYVRPSFQCLQKLLLPPSPYVFGILLQRWETPWAKVFPIRLMLRLGAEFRYYPCPLISVRFRKPVFGEIGHTIMNLLADFKNYQYMLPQIRGVFIHMEDKKTYINFPRNRYDDVMKVITNSNDHVMAMGANFSMEADSHLVCIQNEDGNYQTQAINIQNKPRKVTGASFVVFNGALKTSSGLRAKSSIVEDGLMVQITADSMIAMKQALRDMTDYVIGCGAVETPSPEEQVHIRWTDDDKNLNQGVCSPIDNMAMDGVESVHIHNATDYVGETRTIRWTEVFFIQNEDHGSHCEPVDLSRLAETLAQACCMALTPHLDSLKEAALTKIGLRVTIDRDKVGYECGANNDKLPDFYMNDLDNELIPVIHNAASQSQDGPVVLELIFHVIE